MNTEEPKNNKLSQVTVEQMEEILKRCAPQADKKDKRDYFAGLAMQGILAGRNFKYFQRDDMRDACDAAIKYADELLKQLGD